MPDHRRDQKSELWLSLALLAAWESLVYWQLVSLESGQSESERFWIPIARLYEAAGFWGAMSVLPVLGLCLVANFLVLRLNLQRAVSVLLLAVTGLALWGIAMVVVIPPESEGFQPITLALASPFALMGSGVGYLAWRITRAPLQQLSIPRPSRFVAMAEENKWVQAAIVIAIVAILGGIFGMAAYFSAR